MGKVFQWKLLVSPCYHWRIGRCIVMLEKNYSTQLCWPYLTNAISIFLKGLHNKPQWSFCALQENLSRLSLRNPKNQFHSFLLNLTGPADPLEIHCLHWTFNLQTSILDSDNCITDRTCLKLPTDCRDMFKHTLFGKAHAWTVILLLYLPLHIIDTRWVVQAH